MAIPQVEVKLFGQWSFEDVAVSSPLPSRSLGVFVAGCARSMVMVVGQGFLQRGVF